MFYFLFSILGFGIATIFSIIFFKIKGGKLSQTKEITKNKKNKETQSENKKLKFESFSIFQTSSIMSAIKIKKDDKTNEEESPNKLIKMSSIESFKEEIRKRNEESDRKFEELEESRKKLEEEKKEWKEEKKNKKKEIKKLKKIIKEKERQNRINEEFSDYEKQETEKEYLSKKKFPGTPKTLNEKILE